MSKQIPFKNKCRTCLGQTKVMNSLENLADTETTVSFADLLKTVVNINVKDDENIELPQHICSCCSRKLKSSHTFIRQAREINERMWSLINTATVDKQKFDCLVESEIKIECCEDQNVEPPGMATEMPCIPLDFPIKTELSEDSSSGNENKGSKLDSQVKAENCNLVERVNFRNKIENSNESYNNNFNNNDEADEVMALPRPNNKSEDNADSKMDFTDDEKCSVSMKSNMINIDDSTECSSNEPIAQQILRKRKKKPKQIACLEENDDDIPVPCQKCNKIFNNSKELTTHLRNAHVPEEQKCSCPVCGATFTRTCNMYTHMRSFHESEYLHNLCKSKDRLHECETCHRKYASKKNLNFHIKLKHNQEGETIETPYCDTNQKDTSKKYEVRPLCSICGASVCNKAQLIIHMRRHTGEKPFKCELCDRNFLQITDLNNHRRIHTGEKPYKCKICDKAFRLSTKLSNHMRSHTDERPYKCSQCERSFKYSKDLNIHNRIHTGERPYSCSVCGSTFTQSNSLKTHRMKLGHMDNYL